jgi:glycopeptide antibiotics resistance protein
LTEQIVSLIGAGMILFAYAAQYLQKMRTTDALYALLNLAGSLILAVIAFRLRQTGITLLESAWAVISGAALIRSFRK